MEKVHSFKLMPGTSYTVERWTESSNGWEYNNTDTYEHSAIEPIVGYQNLDNNSWGNNEEFYFTQTLFNDDEMFEYIRLDYDNTPDTTTYALYLIDHLFRDISYKGKLVGFSIMQEDGNVVQSVKIQEELATSYLSFLLIKMNNKIYLVVYDESDYTKKCIFYRIEKLANGIVKQVAALPGMKVSPHVADRKENITVELGEGCNAREIQVVNAAGQTVKRISVAKGQSQVSFSADGLGRGMNIVRVGQNSTKIIVK